MTEKTESKPTREESLKLIADIIRDVKFAMLTTVTGEGHLHARPMTTQQVEFDGDLWFLAAKDGEAVADIRARPQVNVSYSKPEKGEYASINGSAELIEDKAKLDELWSDIYKAYYPQGKEDPNIQLVKVSAHGAEYWKGEGTARTLLELAKGLLTRKQADLGKNDAVNL